MKFIKLSSVIICYFFSNICNGHSNSSSHNNGHHTSIMSSTVVLILDANPNVHIDRYKFSLFRTCVYYTESETFNKTINDTNITNITNMSIYDYIEDGPIKVYCELNLGQIILAIIISIYLSAVYIIICGLPKCIKTKELYKEQLDFP